MIRVGREREREKEKKKKKNKKQKKKMGLKNYTIAKEEDVLEQLCSQAF